LKVVPQLLLGRAFFAHELCLGVTHVSQRTLKKTREERCAGTPNRPNTRNLAISKNEVRVFLPLKGKNQKPERLLPHRGFSKWPNFSVNAFWEGRNQIAPGD